MDFLICITCSIAKDSPDSGVVDNAVDNARPAYVEQDSFEDGLEDFPIIGTCLALYTFEGAYDVKIIPVGDWTTLLNSMK